MRAAPDGYTLHLTATSDAVNATFMKSSASIWLATSRQLPTDIRRTTS